MSYFHDPPRTKCRRKTARWIRSPCRSPTPLQAIRGSSRDLTVAEAKALLATLDNDDEKLLALQHIIRTSRFGTCELVDVFVTDVAKMAAFRLLIPGAVDVDVSALLSIVSSLEFPLVGAEGVGPRQTRRRTELRRVKSGIFNSSHGRAEVLLRIGQSTDRSERGADHTNVLRRVRTRTPPLDLFRNTEIRMPIGCGWIPMPTANCRGSPFMRPSGYPSCSHAGDRPEPRQTRRVFKKTKLKCRPTPRTPHFRRANDLKPCALCFTNAATVAVVTVGTCTCAVRVRDDLKTLAPFVALRFIWVFDASS